MIIEQYEYIENTLHTFRLRKEVYLKPKAKKGAKPEVIGIYYLL